jgi:hypothetical protein
MRGFSMGKMLILLWLMLSVPTIDQCRAENSSDASSESANSSSDESVSSADENNSGTKKKKKKKKKGKKKKSKNENGNKGKKSDKNPEHANEDRFVILLASAVHKALGKGRWERYVHGKDAIKNIKEEIVKCTESFEKLKESPSADTIDKWTTGLADLLKLILGKNSGGESDTSSNSENKNSSETSENSEKENNSDSSS